MKRNVLFGLLSVFLIFLLIILPNPYVVIAVGDDTNENIVEESEKEEEFDSESSETISDDFEDNNDEGNSTNSETTSTEVSPIDEEQGDSENSNQSIIEEDKKQNKDFEENSINLFSNAILEEGDRNESVIKLKQDLNLLGFHVTMNYPNRFGPATTNAVRKFQEYYKLPVTGNVDNTTSTRLKNIIDNAFIEGDRNKKVKELKENLNKLGFRVTMNYPDRYGPATTSAVKKFQKAHSLIESGVAEESTFEKITDLLASGYKEGQRRKGIETLKRNLNRLGFHVTMNYPDRYGPATTSAVRKFQRYYNLPVTGEADHNTLNRIKNLLDSAFVEGQSDPKIKELKSNLNILGFTVSMNYPNRYGPATTSAVKKFQKAHSLIESGVAEESTIKKINSLLNTGYSEGQSSYGIRTLKENLNILGFHVTMNYPDRYGPATTSAVRKFQEYYDLPITGKAEAKTLLRLHELLINSYMEGQRDVNIKILKENLNKLGFHVTMNYPDRYGSATTSAVKSFQKTYSLVVSGIAEEKTLNKLSELLAEQEESRVNIDYTDYPLTLNQAVDIQYNQRGAVTDQYNNIEAYVYADYVDFIRPNTINYSVVNIRSKPNTSSAIVTQLKLGDAVEIIDAVDGTVVSNSKVWYQIRHKNAFAYVHSSLVDLGKAVVTSNSLNVRLGPGKNHHLLGSLKKNDEVKVKIFGKGWHKIEYNNRWKLALKEDIKRYMDPNNFDRMQHIRLDTSIGVSARELNKVLNKRGILEGKGQAFINGARKAGLNEAYLISHALLETGNGKSVLARGYKYKDKIVYNMYGIGAYDHDPLKAGAKKAYEEGWFTPEDAIIGGASWIAKQYIYNEFNQNTLYKMRWNPRMHAGGAWKQYATDIGWAVKQINRIKEIYESVRNPNYHYDIVRYK